MGERRACPHKNILQNGYSITLVISLTKSNFSNKAQYWAQANQFSLTVTFSTLNTFRPGKNRQRENSFNDPCFNGSICTHFIGNREVLTTKCFLFLSYTGSKPTFVFLQLRREGNSSYNKNHPSQHFG